MNKDTRNNWMTFMFKCKCGYNCLRKQSIIDDCENAFRTHEKLGFQFIEIGFGGNHTHFTVNVPKRYSIEDAEIMLKSHSSRMLFLKHPNLRKRYPRGAFWSGYEYHQSTGLVDLEESNTYIRSQREHHQVNVIDDRQHKLTDYSASGDT